MDRSPDPSPPHYFPPPPTFERRTGNKLGFLLGWSFFVLAFLAAAAERLVSDGAVTSFYKVWYSLRPGSLIVFQILIEKHVAPWVWNPVLTTLLALPGWLLFGLPSGLLLWFCRPHKTPEAWAEEEAYGTYDRLAKAAEEEGAVPDDPRWSEIAAHEPDQPDLPPDDPRWQEIPSLDSGAIPPTNEPPADTTIDGRSSSDDGRVRKDPTR